MTTIDEADVIRIIKDNPRLVFNAMREDPELLKEVRQAILTDELLGLPRQFARMSDTLETLVGVVSDTNARVERVESMVERIPPLETQGGAGRVHGGTHTALRGAGGSCRSAAGLSCGKRA